MTEILGQGPVITIGTGPRLFVRRKSATIPQKSVDSVRYVRTG